MFLSASTRHVTLLHFSPNPHKKSWAFAWFNFGWPPAVTFFFNYNIHLSVFVTLCCAFYWETAIFQAQHRRLWISFMWVGNTRASHKYFRGSNPSGKNPGTRGVQRRNHWTNCIINGGTFGLTRHLSESV